MSYLKIFTFLEKAEIEALETSVKEEAHLRKAQRTLAEEMTRLIHGEESLEQAIRISAALFSGDVKELSPDEIEQGLKDVPTYEHGHDEESGLVDVLVAGKISSSRRQAREDIQNGAISINGERVTDIEYTLGEDDKLGGKFTVIRRGRRRYHLVNYK